MKARHEFESDQAYDVYLEIYFMGQLVAGMTANPDFHLKGEFISRNVRTMAHGMVEELKQLNHSDAPNK